MSSLRQDADGRQSLDWDAIGHHYTVVASTDGRWLTVSFDEGIVTVPVPSAAVAEKLAEMFARVGATWRDREQKEAQLDYRERIAGASK